MNLKRLIRAGCRFLSDRSYRFLICAGLGLYNSMESEAYLTRKYRAALGYSPDLSHPVTFNEKLQYLKLHDRDPRYTTMVDKVAVKDYVANIIGPEHIIPTIGTWERAEDIDFDALPAKFALKCSHNSGLGMCICKDKSQLNIPKVRRALNQGLQQDYYLTGREWPYKDVPRRILAEEFLENGANGLVDYKIHCFSGTPKFILVCQDRFSGTGLTEDFFTPEWEHMDLRRPSHPNASQPIPRPAQLEQLLAYT